MSLTIEQINELRALLAKATEGEWKRIAYDARRSDMYDDDWSVEAVVIKDGQSIDVNGICGDATGYDAAFIAAAKNAMSELLDLAEWSIHVRECDKANAVHDSLKGVCKFCGFYMGDNARGCPMCRQKEIQKGGK